MTEIIVGLMLIAGVILMCIICMLYEAGEVNEWMCDDNNLRRIRSHYGSEGISFYLNYSNQTVCVGFLEKGTYQDRHIPFTKAYKLFKETPNGGIRRKLLEYLK